MENPPNFVSRIYLPFAANDYREGGVGRVINYIHPNDDDLFFFKTYSSVIVRHHDLALGIIHIWLKQEGGEYLGFNNTKEEKGKKKKTQLSDCNYRI